MIWFVTITVVHCVPHDTVELTPTAAAAARVWKPRMSPAEPRSWEYAAR